MCHYSHTTQVYLLVHQESQKHRVHTVASPDPAPIPVTVAPSQNPAVFVKGMASNSSTGNPPARVHAHVYHSQNDVPNNVNEIPSNATEVTGISTQGNYEVNLGGVDTATENWVVIWPNYEADNTEPPQVQERRVIKINAVVSTGNNGPQSTGN